MATRGNERLESVRQGTGTVTRDFTDMPVPVHWIDTEPVKSSDVPCVMRDLDVKASVCGLYALVEETMVIENPNGRPLSASIQIAMPNRAVVCGYALDIDQQMVDGVVVPKDKARVAFETEQRLGADPGLVEQVRGNVYRTRVYPVPSKGTRTVTLRYVAPLLVRRSCQATLDLPMPAEPLQHRNICIEVDRMDGATPQVEGLGTAGFRQARNIWRVEAEDRDLESGAGVRVSLPELPTSISLLEKSGDGTVWFCASRQAKDTSEAELPTVKRLTVLWDASGSRGPQDHAAELDLLRRYATGPGLEALDLVVFAHAILERRSFDTADELVGHIEGLAYDGGTDFTALARDLQETAVEGDGHAYVLFTDGLDTLSGEVLSLPSTCDILAVATGTERDVESLRQAAKGCAFDLATAPRDFDAFVRELFCPRRLRGVEGPGVADVLGIGSGADGRYTVIGRLVAAKTSMRFEGDEDPFELCKADARMGETLARAWAALRVSQLSPRADDNADELLALGRRFGVVSPVTSLIVFETLDQWLRYEIEPPKSLREMHREYKRICRGRMRHTSEEAERREHLRNLISAWRGLLGWWKKDHAKVRASGPGRPAMGGRAAMRMPRRMGAMGDMAMDVMESPAGFADGMAPEADAMMMACEAPMAVAASVTDGAPAPDAAPSPEAPSAATVFVKPWQPDAPYLCALDEACEVGDAASHETYRRLRPDYVSTPAFFLDCAGWFLAHGDTEFGLRVLTNLAELRIEDAALLRVMAWRLREAGELGLALTTLRRVRALRPEDSQSHRDLALVLDDLARRSFGDRDEEAARSYIEEAGEAYRKIALTPWRRRAMAIGLFAVEEYNVLRAWAKSQKWTRMPNLPAIDSKLEGLPDCDLRITLAWDADETDVDLHVTEPSGEEAYYGHRFTSAGGRVSEDITDGYGPELYQIRKAQDGTYTIRAHYFASHQQTVFGPATCTLTVFTDWGRTTQKQKITSVRLDDAKEMLFVGTASYGTGDTAEEEEPARVPVPPEVTFGMSLPEVIDVFGAPDENDEGDGRAVLAWRLPGGRVRVATFEDSSLQRMVERMPWGDEMVIV